jgi:hypothetical protein
MQITKQLQGLQGGNRDGMNDIIPLAYNELKKLARSHLRRELNALPLDTTALVHEAFLKLAGSWQPLYENCSHFYGIASRLMRQVLVDGQRSTPTTRSAPRSRSIRQKRPSPHPPSSTLRPRTSPQASIIG